MKEWSVSIPITAIAFLIVEAETEEEAIKKGLEQAELKNCEEWEALRQIVKGNVFYGSQNEAEATEV